MKRIFLLLLLAAILSDCNNSRSKESAKAFTGEISKDVKILILPGDHSVSVLGGIMQTPRQKALMNKFHENARKNQEWFVKFLKSIPEGQPMPYHENIGLTRQEYDELMNHINSVEIVSTGIETLTVELKNDTMSFWGNGKLKELNSLQLDLKNNIALLGEYRIPFSDTANITDANNGLQSKWQGYNWKYEWPANVSLNELSDLTDLTIKQYELTIGRLEKNGKTFLRLKGREIENGIRAIEFDIPVIIL